MNNHTINLYKVKVSGMGRTELEEIAAMSLYHLQVLSGSRNSFKEIFAPIPERSEEVGKSHMEAAQFSIANQV